MKQLRLGDKQVLWLISLTVLNLLSRACLTIRHRPCVAKTHNRCTEDGRTYVILCTKDDLNVQVHGVIVWGFTDGLNCCLVHTVIQTSRLCPTTTSHTMFRVEATTTGR